MSLIRVTLAVLMFCLASNTYAAPKIYRGPLKDIPNISTGLVRLIEAAVPAIVGEEVVLVDYPDFVKMLKSQRGKGNDYVKATEFFLRLAIGMEPEVKLKMLQDMKSGALPEMTLVTHQKKELQANTAKFLNSSPQKDIPSFVLADRIFPIKSKRLLRAANFIVLSKLGKFDWLEPPAAKSVKAMGGYCGMCLRQSVFNVIDSTAKVGIDGDMAVHVIPELTYMDNMGTLLADILLQKGKCGHLDQSTGKERFIHDYSIGRGKNSPRAFPRKDGSVLVRDSKGFRYTLITK